MLIQKEISVRQKIFSWLFGSFDEDENLTNMNS